MKRTELKFSSQLPLIEPNDKIILLGSCFSDNIGGKLVEHKFDAVVNPFGVVFHPMPIFNLLRRAIEGSKFVSDDFFEYDNYWFSYSLGSKMAFESINAALQESNNILESFRVELKKAKHLILTFGTANGFIRQGNVVANCHKQPGNQFDKIMSSVDDIQSAAVDTLKSLYEFNKELKVQLTVSPVRHVKDGLLDNGLSKAILRVVCAQIEKKWDAAEYFPVYEFVVDSLRGYEYFSGDGVHLNEFGIEKVWEFFVLNRFTYNSDNKRIDVVELNKMYNHVVLFEKTSANLKFQKTLLSKLEKCQQELNIDFSFEIQEVKKRLTFLE